MARVGGSSVVSSVLDLDMTMDEYEMNNNNYYDSFYRDDQSYGSRLTVGDLYQRLESLRILHEKTSRKYMSLSSETNTYAGIDSNSHVQFDLALDMFSSDEVLCINIHNITNAYDVEKNDLDKLNIQVSLFQRDSKSNEYIALPLKAAFLNGNYSYTLTSAEISAGQFRIFVDNSVDMHQSIRVGYRIQRLCRATPLEFGKSVRGKVGLNQTNFYRLVVPDRNQVLTIRCRPLTDSAEKLVGDVDLLVTNEHRGLVGVTRESAVWSSLRVGEEVVHVHPDDPRTGLGSVFLVGIAGFRDGNDYELEPSLSELLPIRQILIHTPLDFQLTEARPFYFFVDIDPLYRGSTYIIVGGDKSKVDMETLELDESYGHLVYTSDSLGTHGLICSGIEGSSNVSRRAGQSIRGLFPVVYISFDDIYPDERNFSWRASSIDDRVVIKINNKEMLPGGPVRCYISVCGLRVGSMSDGGTSYSCVQTVLIPDEIVGGNPALCFRYALLQQVFESVDGAGISQSDRSRLQLDDSALTYSEIEIASFGDLLSTADARDGQVFYDLGCGVGKAVATAVMSETHFVRVVGIELLPTLCQTALTALQELKSKLLDRSSYYEDTSIISASSAFEIRQGDFFELDWSDGDLVFISSGCYSDASLSRLLLKLRQLKPGSLAILTRLPSNWEIYFGRVTETWLALSFGKVLANVLRRNSEDAAILPV